MEASCVVQPRTDFHGLGACVVQRVRSRDRGLARERTGVKERGNPTPRLESMPATDVPVRKLPELLLIVSASQRSESPGMRDGFPSSRSADQLICCKASPNPFLLPDDPRQHSLELLLQPHAPHRSLPIEPLRKAPFKLRVRLPNERLAVIARMNVGDLEGVRGVGRGDGHGGRDARGGGRGGRGGGEEGEEGEAVGRAGGRGGGRGGGDGEALCGDLMPGSGRGVGVGRARRGVSMGLVRERAGKMADRDAGRESVGRGGNGRQGEYRRDSRARRRCGAYRRRWCPSPRR